MRVVRRRMIGATRRSCITAVVARAAKRSFAAIRGVKQGETTCSCTRVRVVPGTCSFVLRKTHHPRLRIRSTTPPLVVTILRRGKAAAHSSTCCIKREYRAADRDTYPFSAEVDEDAYRGAAWLVAGSPNELRE